MRYHRGKRNSEQQWEKWSSTKGLRLWKKKKREKKKWGKERFEKCKAEHNYTTMVVNNENK